MNQSTVERRFVGRLCGVSAMVRLAYELEQKLRAEGSKEKETKTEPKQDWDSRWTAVEG